MEKDRGARVIAIVALLIAVVGLSVGFAVMSSTLTISSTAEVKPNENDFTVQFSTNSSTITGEGPTVVGTTSSTAVTASTATIANGTKSSTLSGIHATFTEPGQSATYTFYAVNGGKYTAYLNSIAFGKASGATGNEFKVCTKGTDTTEETVNGGTGITGACDGISLKLSVGSLSNLDDSSSGLGDISSHSLAPLGETGNGETVTVVITYAANAARADGDFTVAFGDITMTYGAVD